MRSVYKHIHWTVSTNNGLKRAQGEMVNNVDKVRCDVELVEISETVIFLVAKEWYGNGVVW